MTNQSKTERLEVIADRLSASRTKLDDLYKGLYDEVVEAIEAEITSNYYELIKSLPIEIRELLIEDSKKVTINQVTYLSGLMIQLDRQIMSEDKLFAWGWNGYTREPHEINRKYIARALRDIYYPPGVDENDQPGTTIYPSICAASQETIDMLKEFNLVKKLVKFHMSLLNKFKYYPEQLPSQSKEKKAIQKRMGEMAIAELNMGQIHKTKLYRQVNFTELPIHKIGLFWGTSPKVECLPLEEVLKIIKERADFAEREKMYQVLSKVGKYTQLAYVTMVKKSKEDLEQVPFRRTAPRLNYHYYSQEPNASEFGEGPLRSISKQQTAVMPFFYLHRPDTEVDVSELADDMVVGDRAWRGHRFLKDKPLIESKHFQIFEYTVQPQHRNKNTGLANA